MSLSHIAVAIAALAVVGVIIAQDVLYAPFRRQTVSQGLNGPNHVALDIAFGVLGLALVWASHGLLLACAIVCALGLFGISVTNTAWRWVDSLVGRLGGHEPIHLYFTIVVFAGAAAFEVVGDFGRGALGWSSIANLLAALIVWALTKQQDVTEKVGVGLLCLWLFAWAI